MSGALARPTSAAPQVAEVVAAVAVVWRSVFGAGLAGFAKGGDDAGDQGAQEGETGADDGDVGLDQGPDEGYGAVV